jgi:hypothetical protein
MDEQRSKDLAERIENLIVDGQKEVMLGIAQLQEGQNEILGRVVNLENGQLELKQKMQFVHDSLKYVMVVL